MARYAERNKFMQSLKTNEYGETTVTEVAIAFEKAETEVVPKSEFETLQCKYELAVAEREANVKAFTEELDKYRVMIQLLESDISDRDKMLEAKVEEVYADFMQDYKCMREELDGLYDEYAKLKKKYTEQCPDCKHFVGCEKAVWHGLCEEYDKNTTEERNDTK